MDHLAVFPAGFSTGWYDGDHGFRKPLVAFNKPAIRQLPALMRLPHPLAPFFSAKLKNFSFAL